MIFIYYQNYIIHWASTEGFFLNNASFFSNISFITWFFFSLKYSLIRRFFISTFSIFLVEFTRFTYFFFSSALSTFLLFNNFWEHDLSTLLLDSFPKFLLLWQRDGFLLYHLLYYGSLDRYISLIVLSFWEPTKSIIFFILILWDDSDLMVRLVDKLLSYIGLNWGTFSLLSLTLSSFSMV